MNQNQSKEPDSLHNNPFGPLVGKMKAIYNCTHLQKKGSMYVSSKALCFQRTNFFGKRIDKPLIVTWKSVHRIEQCTRSEDIKIHCNIIDITKIKEGTGASGAGGEQVQGGIRIHQFENFKGKLSTVKETIWNTWKDRDKTLDDSSMHVVEQLCDSTSFMTHGNSKIGLLDIVNTICTLDYRSNDESVEPFLIEVVSVSGLANQGCFIEFYSGGRKIHRTKSIHQKFDPVWTVDTGALFLYELLNGSEEDELLVKVKSTKVTARNNTVGEVLIPTSKLLSSQGRRQEFTLFEKNERIKTAHVLSLRCRRASRNDLEFIQKGKKAASQIRENFDSIVTPYRLKLPNVFKRRQKVIDGNLYFLALPQDETKGEQWFREEELQELIDRPSEAWTSLYSDGKLGKLYVEILSCEGLPAVNMLNQPRKGNPFITIVHENSVATTDAIPNCANPRYLPWSRRAFKMRIKHASSPLFLGVHDWSPLKTSKHQPLGRIAIRLNRFQSKTTYNLSYTLYSSSHSANREPRGIIKLRLRLEWADDRQAFFDTLRRPTKTMIVNVDNEKDYSHSYFTVNGERSFRKFSMDRMIACMDELQSYFPPNTNRYNLYHEHIESECKNILMWKKTYRMRSTILFISAFVVVEYPQYTVSILSAAIAYAMLLLLRVNRERPNKWSKPPNYRDTLKLVMTGKTPNEDIAANENLKEDSVFMKKYNERIQEEERQLNMYRDEIDEEAKRTAMLESEWMQGLYNEKDRGRMNTIFCSIFEKFYPKALVMGDLVHFFRFIERVFTWDNYSLAFILTSSCIIFSLFSALVIYLRIWLWIKRIVVWVCLGPWFGVIRRMWALVNTSNNDLIKTLTRTTQKKSSEALWRKEREDNLKAVAMKKYMFGDYGLEVPDLYFRGERHQSIPLVESSAVHVSDSKSEVKEIDKLIEKSNRTAVIVGQGNGISGDNLIPLNYLDHVNNDVTLYKSFRLNDASSSQDISSALNSYIDHGDDKE